MNNIGILVCMSLLILGIASGALFKIIGGLIVTVIVFYLCVYIMCLPRLVYRAVKFRSFGELFNFD